eukprot:TRINITY_DN4659_c0_g1_i1.p1 TRINITY_DN4659_c0_g1~~TRINITY_DN4659_c0_g1_i1.p1  ORF type:complete len:317 (-),score=142.38 TRINITY_DN4659_c0_g1_i1:143-1048(-)
MEFQVKDPETILNSLEDLRTHSNEINWVSLSYEGDKIAQSGTGKGGLDQVFNLLKDDEIRFVVLEVTVKGDEYNPVKFVLITWIGSKVPPGIGKAKAGAHRPKLVEFVEKKLAISAEFQPSARSDLTSSNLADKLTRIAKQDASVVEEKKHAAARPELNKGDRSKSSLKVVDPEGLKKKLQRVHTRQVQWMTLGIPEGSKDEVAYLGEGNGYDSLKKEFPENKIVYAVFSQQVTETTTTTNKILLISMIGPNAGPLVKARSSAHRAELADFIQEAIPFHSHYQALTVADLKEEEVLSKLRQ